MNLAMRALAGALETLPVRLLPPEIFHVVAFVKHHQRLPHFRAEAVILEVAEIGEGSGAGDAEVQHAPVQTPPQDRGEQLLRREVTEFGKRIAHHGEVPGLQVVVVPKPEAVVMNRHDRFVPVGVRGQAEGPDYASDDLAGPIPRAGPAKKNFAGGDGRLLVVRGNAPQERLLPAEVESGQTKANLGGADDQHDARQRQAKLRVEPREAPVPMERRQQGQHRSRAHQRSAPQPQ